MILQLRFLSLEIDIFPWGSTKIRIFKFHKSTLTDADIAFETYSDLDRSIRLIFKEGSPKPIGVVAQLVLYPLKGLFVVEPLALLLKERDQTMVQAESAGDYRGLGDQLPYVALFGPVHV